MSSDEENGMRFGWENDFEGGQWIDGEFYYESVKKKKKMSKEEQLYGVFLDEEGGFGFQGAKGRKERNKMVEGSTLLKPLSFVSGGAQNSEKSKNYSREKENRTGIGAESKSSTEPTSQSKPTQEKETRQVKSKTGNISAIKGDFAQFENHTKGFGLKMLMKMGFKGRLGKEEQGISQPIQVKARPDNRGLGFGQFREATSLKVNQVIEREIRGEIVEEEGNGVEEEAQRLAELAGVKQQDGWKKKQGESTRRKKQYKTAAQVLLENRSEKPSTSAIIDMRGPQVRVLHSLEDLSSQDGAAHILAQEMVTEKLKIGKELKHNVAILRNAAEARIKRLDRLKHERVETNRRVQSELERISKMVSQQRTEIARFHQVKVLLEQLKDSSHPPSQIELFGCIALKHPDQFKRLNLIKSIPAVLIPAIKSFLQSWKPLENPKLPVSLVSQLQELLFSPSQQMGDIQHIPVDEEEFNMSDEDSRVHRKKSRKQKHKSPAIDAVEAQAIMSYILESTILPPVRRVLVNKWIPQDCNSAVSLMEVMETLLPSSMFAMLCEQTLMPRITRAVDEWNPRTETIPIHVWVHPWLPLLGIQRVSTLFPSIKQKLNSALAAWHPSDESAKVMLEPWQPVFEKSSFNTIMTTRIVPKLVVALREMVIDPRNQNLEAFRWTTRWRQLVPDANFLALLLGEFFPKWHRTLLMWLTSRNGCDYSEVSAWYTGWKSLFPEDLVNNPHIREQFNRALVWMQQSLSDTSSLTMVLAQLNGITYESVLQQLQQYTAVAPALGETSRYEEKPRVLAVEDGADLSFREVVERFALDNGVTFLPNTKRGRHDGKQIYLFGSTNVYIDNCVVFALINNEWQPISLEVLLRYAKSLH